MEKVAVKVDWDKIIVGKSPQLVVDLKSQEHYILASGRKIPYRQIIQISQDLVRGKRKQVLQTAMEYYYRQACEVAEGMAVAEDYRKKANVTIRVK